MILSTFIVTFYMLLVYVVGGEDGGTTWSALTCIALIGTSLNIPEDVPRKICTEALVDDDAEEIISAIKSVVISSGKADTAIDGEE